MTEVLQKLNDIIANQLMAAKHRTDLFSSIDNAIITIALILGIPLAILCFIICADLKKIKKRM